MDIMIDLETLSTASDAAIVAIGACTFGHSPEIERQTFYRAIDARSAQDAGGRIDGDTVLWWLGQSDAARLALLAPDRASLGSALFAFSYWLGQWTSPRVWGNGANFDNVVLRGAFLRLGQQVPWSYKQDRCYRTLKDLRPDIAPITFGDSLTLHNALDDALAQASHAERLLAAISVEG